MRKATFRLIALAVGIGIGIFTDRAILNEPEIDGQQVVVLDSAESMRPIERRDFTVPTEIEGWKVVMVTDSTDSMRVNPK